MKVKLRVNRDNHVYYPDVMVVRDRDPEEDRYVGNPKLIVEVLSTSTAGVDRHEKRIAYREIAVLEEYVIIAQESVEVTVYRRAAEWRPVLLQSRDAAVELASIGLTLSVSRIYEGEALGC